MKDSIKTIDCIGDGQQSQAPSDAIIIPAAETLREILKDELRCASFCKNRQSDDRNDEEQKVKNSANKFQGGKKFTEPEIKDERHKDQRPHKQCRMPAFGYIIIVIENGETNDNIRDDGRASSTASYPGENCQPS